MKVIIIIGFLMFSLVSCNDGLDIKQDYDFDIKLLPIPKKLKSGESAILEFSIIRTAYYDDTEFSFRYFQQDGKGILYNDEGVHFVMNRYYKVKDRFKMVYQSICNELQTLDFVFTDSFGKEIEYSISFQPDNSQ